MADSEIGSSLSKRARVYGPESKITVRVIGQDGDEHMFRIGYTVKMGNLMTAYCKKKDLDRRVARFVYKGKRVNAKQTPSLLHMKEDAQIDAFLEMPGGGLSN